MTAANPHKGDVAFEIDGKTWTLRFSIDAICVLEERTGKTLMELSADLKDFKTVRMSLVRDILYAGLIEHHPDISVKEAGELILAAGGSLVVMNKFNVAMAAAYSPPAGSIAANGASPARGAEASGTPRPPKRRRRGATG